jgi:hypothetical protein
MDLTQRDLGVLNICRDVEMARQTLQLRKTAVN